jgi:sortase A
MERPLASPLYSLTAARRQPRGLARVARDAAWVLIISGLLLVVDAGVTVLWQEPVTAVVGLVARGRIDQRLLRRPPAVSALDRRAMAGLSVVQRVAFLARREQRELSDGEAVGRLRIPRIGATFVVVQGTDAASLEKGPGHYPSTALPGMGRTVAIAGHRTTFLAPFRHIDALRPGDRIVLSMPYGRFLYVVQGDRIVTPLAWWITRDVGYERLVLSACNPPYSAAQRIVVFARLVSMRPAGRAFSSIYRISV